MPTVKPSPTPTTGCDYCLAATHIIEMERKAFAKAMAKINQLEKEIAKLERLLAKERWNATADEFNQWDSISLMEQEEAIKALQENEG